MKSLTPRWIYFSMFVALIATVICHFFLATGTEWVSFAGKELAYLLATSFCLQIAAEYRRQPLLRLAWLLLAANGIVSLLRHILELSMLERIPQIHLYRQTSITLALLFLLGGMVAMARAFLQTGLGFRIHRSLFSLASP